MGVKYTTRKDGFPKMTKEFGKLNGKGIEVGVLDGEHVWLAAIHEYGMDIEVTPKMRSFLHREGLHLNPETTHIHIPERSFLRTGYDESRDEVAKHATMLIAEVTEGRMSANGCMKAIGMELASKIKDYARDLSEPKNHPFTIERKGSSNPLVGGGKDDGEGDGKGGGGGGDMIEGINWREAK